ncbi:hypothetical protein CDAR_619131 [Caerostris darwini]|uniref:Uncharacterized protein n=1 Tax=Caerostris darwini TaxID=1538125 RepID=A0AAV4U2M1_9ARAC|nr:hypothetical protein CDAR_619131 [Caerostris darwini]
MFSIKPPFVSPKLNEANVDKRDREKPKPRVTKLPERKGTKLSLERVSAWGKDFALTPVPEFFQKVFLSTSLLDEILRLMVKLLRFAQLCPSCSAIWKNSQELLSSVILELLC